MKYSFIIIALSIIGFNGCSLTKHHVSPKHKKTNTKSTMNYEKPTKAKSIKFHASMDKVAQSTQSNPNYKKMALNTPQRKAWFKNLMYRLWDRQITRTQFIDEGLKYYPTHRYEFNFIANGFQKYS